MMRSGTQRRGFVLLVILVVAIAATAAAIGVVTIGGRASTASSASAGGEQARVIAETGLIRTEKWAKAVSAANGDFDLALDPDFNTGSGANCANIVATGVVTPGATTNVPKFTEASATVTVYNGKNWREVPYGGGAYLVRVDDDDDDDVADPTWDTFSSNHKGTNGGAPFCVEGPTDAGGHDNPARDRDRAVWVTSIGIFPGTDPNTAKSRVVERKLVVDSAPVSAGPEFQTGGSIHGAVTLCTSIGAVTASGDYDDLGTGVGCGCGKNTTPSGQFQNFDSCGACCAPGPGQNQIQAAVPPVAPKGAFDASYFDWTSSCIFFLDPAQGLFFWDGSATATGRASSCSSYSGNLIPPPAAVGFNPATAFPAGAAACWVPLVRFDLSSPFAGGEIDLTTTPGSALWKPSTASVAYNSNFNGLLSSAVSGTKPDWSQCPTGSAQLLWNPPSPNPGAGVEQPHCTGAAGSCDGNTTVITFNPATVNPAQRFVLQDAKPAYPVALFVHNGAFTHDVAWAGPALLPQSPSSGFAMITLLVNGVLTVNGRLELGAGTKANTYASLAATGVVVNSGGRLDLAGSLQTVAPGTVTVNSGGRMEVHGIVRSAGTLTANNGGLLDWDYKVNLTGGGGGATVPAPLTVTPAAL